MKHLKTYEGLIEDEPQVGDSVICTDIGNENDLNTFLSQNIGTMVGYDIRQSEKLFPYIIKYDDIPEELIEFFSFKGKTRHFSREEILQFTPQLNKFNL